MVFIFSFLKPWPNGLASRRKMKTWDYLRVRVANPSVCSLWIIFRGEAAVAQASICVDFR